MVKSNWFICFSVTSWRFHGFFSFRHSNQTINICLITTTTRALRDTLRISATRKKSSTVSVFLFVHFSPGSQLRGPGFLLSPVRVSEGFAQIINFINLLGYCFTRKNPYFWGKIFLMKKCKLQEPSQERFFAYRPFAENGRFSPPIFGKHSRYVFVYGAYTKFWNA